jgi:cell division septation protein DedD
MTQEVEREIVLGNKQLISLFFVVVALCGVVFALGYMMGSNRSKPATVNLDATATTAAASSISPAPAPPVQESEPPRETAPDETSAPGPAPTEAASTTTPAPTPTPTQVHTKPAQETPEAAESSGAMWLQVTALKRTDADDLVKTLREQNFPAVVASSSKPDLFRVLVGPYHQTADVADAKSRLKALGFANAFVQK